MDLLRISKSHPKNPKSNHHLLQKNPDFHSFFLKKSTEVRRTLPKPGICFSTATTDPGDVPKILPPTPKKFPQDLEAGQGFKARARTDVQETTDGAEGPRDPELLHDCW